MYAVKLAIGVMLAMVTITGPAALAQSAKADLKGPDGKAFGTVTLREMPAGGVLLRLDASGLPPGEHGFHIHETGKCTPDFSAAGDHFAPRGHKHGTGEKGGPHAGDMPNIHVPASGSIVVEFFVPGVTLAKGEAGSLFDDDGSAIVVHAKPDDYKSQPSGDAGGRIGCGVIAAG